MTKNHLQTAKGPLIEVSSALTSNRLLHHQQASNSFIASRAIYVA